MGWKVAMLGRSSAFLKLISYGYNGAVVGSRSLNADQAWAYTIIGQWFVNLPLPRYQQILGTYLHLWRAMSGADEPRYPVNWGVPIRDAPCWLVV